MRIEKTSMDFVRFDAKDVIQTSWAGFGMYASNALINKYNNERSENSIELQANGKFAGAYGFRYDLENNRLGEDNVYSWSSPIRIGASSWDEEKDTYGNLTYKQAKNVQDIVDWLTQNGFATISQ